MNATDQDLERSRGILKFTLIPNSVFIPIGVLAMIFSILIITVIKSTKKLHTKCCTLIAANAISDFLLGFGYAFVNAVRVWRHFMDQGELVSMWQCFGLVWIIILAQLLSLSMALALVVERLLATYCPFKYKIWTYRHLTIPLLLSAYALTLAQLGMHAKDSWMGRNRSLLSCGIEETVDSQTLSVMTTIQMVISGLVVSLNCLLAYGVWKSKQKIQAHPTGQESVQEMSRNMKDMKIFKTVTIIAITHVLAHLGGRLVIFLMYQLSANDSIIAMTNRVGRQIVVANALVHFFVLFTMSTDFRDASKRLFRLN